MLLLTLSVALTITIVASLGLSYWPLGFWPVYLLIGAFLAFWIIPLRKAIPGFSHLGLLLAISLSVAGTLLGFTPFWMYLTVVLSLAGWVILNLYLDQKKNADPHGMDSTVKKSLLLISALVCFSILIQLLGKTVQITLPFWAVLVIILIFVFCLDRVWRFLQS